MTQEDKEILLRDLCARLPYGVKVVIIKNNHLGTYTLYPSDIDSFKHSFQDIKPYLRPMSSMTEDEKEELAGMCLFYESYSDTDSYSHYGIEIISQYCVNDKLFPENIVECQAIDWLNAHHFDYRGLIEKGLALEAPESMYNLI